LIDKVRLHAKGQLPLAYAANLLGTEHTLDGRFLRFTGLDADGLRQAIFNRRTDDEVLAWVQEQARPAGEQEKRAWAKHINRYRPDPAVIEYRPSMYPELAAKIDVRTVSVFDLIDMHEGRLPLPG
jgi:hypothetical protein